MKHYNGNSKDPLSKEMNPGRGSNVFTKSRKTTSAGDSGMVEPLFELFWQHLYGKRDFVFGRRILLVV
jgi:hypothetical protein